MSSVSQPNYNSQTHHGLMFINSSGKITGLIIIIMFLYFFISTYIPYAQHKELIDVKISTIGLSAAEKNFYAQNKHYASFNELLGLDQKSIDYKGYNIKLEISSDLQHYKITATELEENNKYPNCNKLVINTNKLFSYDTYGLPSQGCW